MFLDASNRKFKLSIAYLLFLVSCPLTLHKPHKPKSTDHPWWVYQCHFIEPGGCGLRNCLMTECAPISCLQSSRFCGPAETYPEEGPENLQESSAMAKTSWATSSGSMTPWSHCNPSCSALSFPGVFPILVLSWAWHSLWLFLSSVLESLLIPPFSHGLSYLQLLYCLTSASSWFVIWWSGAHCWIQVRILGP